jgi:hypothetical protein
MQGVNKIYFERNVNFKTSDSSDESVVAKRVAYFNNMRNAFETACPGWFDNIECENDGEYYNLNFIIDNIQLLQLQMRAMTYYGRLQIKTWYNNGNNSHTPYIMGNDNYGGGNNEACYINAIIYSKNFCGIELSNRYGTDYISTVIIFCRSNLNNTVVIMPTYVLSNMNTNHQDMLTAYKKNYGTNNQYRFSAHTVYSGHIMDSNDDSKKNNKILDNYTRAKSLLYNANTSIGSCNNVERYVMTPLYITGNTEEYCPGVYYLQNIPVVLSTACNAVLEIGKDYYFTNGVVAIKLT